LKNIVIIMANKITYLVTQKILCAKKTEHIHMNFTASLGQLGYIYIYNS